MDVLNLKSITNLIFIRKAFIRGVGLYQPILLSIFYITYFCSIIAIYYIYYTIEIYNIRYWIIFPENNFVTKNIFFLVKALTIIIA